MLLPPVTDSRSGFFYDNVLNFEKINLSFTSCIVQNLHPPSTLTNVKVSGPVAIQSSFVRIPSVYPTEDNCFNYTGINEYVQNSPVKPTDFWN